VLGFVACRLCAERVVLVFADRLPSDQLSALSGIPELPIDGLGGRERPNCCPRSRRGG
jgi:hypothetical protein